jgi:hypothetical protein
MALDHLERRLGPMGGGWSVGEAPAGHKVTVCMFNGGEIPNSTSYATVGLSAIPLRVRGEDRDIRIELMACSYGVVRPKETGYGPWPGILEHLASRSMNSGLAILRGDVIPLPGPIAPGSEMVALYAMPPVYYPDDFASFPLADEGRAAVVWLIPIGAREAKRCGAVGWPVFEAELIGRDPDVLDLGRAQSL